MEHKSDGADFKDIHRMLLQGIPMDKCLIRNNPLFEAVHDYLTLISPDYTIIDYNGTVEGQFGLGIRGRKCFEAYQGRSSICPDCAVSRAIETKAPAFTFQPATKISKPVEIYAYPVLDSQGNVIAVMEHGRDVSEKLLLMEKVRETDEFLKLIIDSSIDPIMVIDAQYNITLMNKAASKSVPAHLQNRQNLKCHEVSHLSPVPCIGEHVCPLDAVRESRKPLTVEHVHGTEYFEISASPLFRPDGSFMGIVESSRNVTERRLYERKLQKSEEKYSALWNSTAIGIAIANRAGHYLDVNNGLVNIFGYSKDELLRMKFSDVSADTMQLSENLNMFEDMVSGRTTGFTIKKKYIHKTGREVWCDLSVYGIYDSAGRFKYCYGLHKDITSEVIAKERVKRDAEVSDALRAVSAIIIREQFDIKALSSAIIQHARKLTRSRHGFVAVLNDDNMAMMGLTLTDMMDEGCETTGDDRRIEFPIGADGKYPSLWGHAINTGKPFYTNRPAEHEASRGLPKGHIEIENFLSVPVIIEGRVVGEIALANPAEDYCEDDIEVINQIADMFAIALKRFNSDNSLRDSEERLSMITEASFEGIVASDHGRIVDANSQFARKFGYEMDELIGMELINLVADDYKELVARNIKTGYVNTYEFDARAKDGAVFSIEVRGRQGVYRGRDVRITAVRDITERKRSEQSLLRALKEKEVLLREIHHRVKNNMAVISSLLSLQANMVDDPKYLSMFRESEGRIRSMALVHEMLYRNESLATVDVRSYINCLVESISIMFDMDRGIETRLDVQQMDIDLDVLIPCGLIINEILTNSYRHAFAGHAAPRVEVALARHSGDKVIMRISDNGSGLPEGFNIEKSKGLGLRLVKTLIKQISGELKLESNGGTSYTVTFPEKMFFAGRS